MQYTVVYLALHLYYTAMIIRLSMQSRYYTILCRYTETIHQPIERSPLPAHANGAPLHQRRHEDGGVRIAGEPINEEDIAFIVDVPQSGVFPMTLSRVAVDR